MTINALPTPPTTADPSTFSAKADALLGALPNFVTQTNAVAVAMNLNSTTDTSTTSDTIAVGPTALTVSAGKSFQPGMYLVIADTAAPSTNSMYGQITSYNSGTGALAINIISVLGSGTKTAWIISQCAPNMDIAGTINGAPNKATPVAADKVGIWDSVTGLLRYISLTNLVTYLVTALTPANATNATNLTGSGTVSNTTTGGNGLTSGDLTGTPIFFAPITASLGADVTLTNAGTYYDGPSVAQGASGKWRASGTITIATIAGGDVFNIKLWDGTTVVASTEVVSSGLTLSVSLSGYFPTNTGNIRISAANMSRAATLMKFNASGNSKDSTIEAVRVG